MANDLNRSIKIYIDGSDAAEGAKKVQDSIAKLKNELAGLNTTEEGAAKRAKELEEKINRQQTTFNKYNEKIKETDRVLKNLSGATYKELIGVQRTLKKELQNLVPGTERYNVVLQQNKRVTEQVAVAQRAMRVEVAAQGSVWQRAAGFVNNYIGVIGTAIAAITGVTLQMNKMRDNMLKRGTAKADTKALTGLDDGSIDWLENQAKKMSTTMDENKVRITQNATEILAAYKLVGSAKPELLENKEALDEVTKQTLILAKASGMDLKDAVDGTTLAMNQFGAGADEAAKYVNIMAAGSKYGSAAVESVTNALSKSGVAAKAANVSIEETVGMIETLAEKGIKDEIAGTGLKKFFLTLQTGADETNPKVVGLQQALETLAAKGMSAAEMKKMFGEEGYNVAQVLLTETDRVKYFTEAVTDTNVAIEQAAINSDTLESKLQQNKNLLHEQGIDLIKILNPALVSMGNKLMNVARYGVEVIAFLVKHSDVVTSAAVAVGVYTVAVNGAEWASKAYAKATALATKVTKGFMTVVKKHPFALISSAIIGGTVALTSWLRKMNDAEQAHRRINKSVEGQVDKQASQLKLWERIAANSNRPLAERLEYVNKLNEVCPEYNASINEQGRLIIANTSAMDDYLARLEKEYRLKAAQEELEEAYRRQRQLERKEIEDQEKLLRAQDQSGKGVYTGNALSDNAARNAALQSENRANRTLKRTQRELQQVNQLIEELNAEINKNVDAVAQASANAVIAGGGSVASGGGGAKEGKYKLEEMKLDRLAADNARYHADLMALNAAYSSGELADYETYLQRKEDLYIEHLQRMLEIADLSAEQRAKVEEQLSNYEVDQRKEADAAKEEAEKDRLKVEADAAKAEEAMKKKRVQSYMSFGEQIGGAFGQMLNGQEDALRSFGDAMVDIVFDILTQIIQAELIELTATGVSETGKATAKAIGKKGIWGAIEGAILSGIIMGAITAARAGLKGLIGKRKDPGSSSYNSADTTSYQRVTQHASGSYDVLGASDGQLYSGVPYIGPAPTGIVNSPALISENGAELIVNAQDLDRLRRHINFPIVMDAINDSRQPYVPQHASGSLPDMGDQPAGIGSALMVRMLRVLERLEGGVQASVSLSELDAKRQLLDQSRKLSKK